MDVAPGLPAEKLPCQAHIGVGTGNVARASGYHLVLNSHTGFKLEGMQTDRSNTELFNALLPLAALVPLTEQALHALPDIHVRRGIAVIYAWPFRIGRESRMLVDEKSGQIARLERYRPAGFTPTNDLYLIDEGQLLSISREHLLI